MASSDPIRVQIFGTDTDRALTVTFTDGKPLLSLLPEEEAEETVFMLETKTGFIYHLHDKVQYHIECPSKISEKKVKPVSMSSSKDKSNRMVLVQDNGDYKILNAANTYGLVDINKYKKACAGHLNSAAGFYLTEANPDTSGTAEEEVKAEAEIEEDVQEPKEIAEEAPAVDIIEKQSEVNQDTLAKFSQLWHEQDLKDSIVALEKCGVSISDSNRELLLSTLFDTISRQTIAYIPRKVNVFEMAKLIIARCPQSKNNVSNGFSIEACKQSAESCIIVGPFNADHFAATLLGVQKSDMLRATMREREPQTIIFDMTTITIDPQEIYDLELDKIAPVILCYKRGVPTPESAKKLPEDLRETFEVKKSSVTRQLLNSQDGACLIRGQSNGKLLFADSKDSLGNEDWSILHNPVLATTLLTPQNWKRLKF